MGVKNPKVYLLHMAECIDNIQDYTKDMPKDVFFDNKMAQDAVVRNFEIIGEAAKQVTNEIRLKYPDIEWKKMAGFRDILIHNYAGVDLDEVWVIIERDLTGLRKNLEVIIEQFD